MPTHLLLVSYPSSIQQAPATPPHIPRLCSRGVCFLLAGLQAVEVCGGGGHAEVDNGWLRHWYIVGHQLLLLLLTHVLVISGLVLHEAILLCLTIIVVVSLLGGSQVHALLTV